MCLLLVSVYLIDLFSPPRYVEFMHHWEANEKPEYMEIAFSSERSIEDELERETYGDIVTIGKLKNPGIEKNAITVNCCNIGRLLFNNEM